MRKGLIIFAVVLAVMLSTQGMLVFLDAQQDGPARPGPQDGAARAGTPQEAEEPAGTPALAGPGAPLVAPLERPEAAAAAAEGPDLLVRSGRGILYGVSAVRGFLVSVDRGQSWLERNEGLPRRAVWPFQAATVRRLTAVGVDPSNPARVAVTTATSLYLSENYGSRWEQIPLGKPLRSSSYLTSVALSASDPDRILLGTSFNGFFETTDRGGSWQDPSLSAGFLYRGAGFYEETSGVSYDPADPRIIYFSCGFARGLYVGAPDRRSWQRVEFPGDASREIIRRLQVQPAGEGWVLEVLTGRSRWQLDLRQGSWRFVERLEEKARPDSFRRERLRKASGRFGIYLSSYNGQGEGLRQHLELLKRQGMNALVVDMKDDFGLLTYDSHLELAAKAGAVDRRFQLEKLLQEAHSRGIYVIGRVVVFKDRQLYNYDGYRYALWDRLKDRPWRYLVRAEEPAQEAGGSDSEDAQTPAPEPRRVQREYWVDPYSEEVWDYNVAIAAELQKRGVDEIQFDYIRFPSDGPTSRIRYRFQRPGMSPIDALESFLTKARRAVHIPISTDLYGFNSWHRMGNWIGQSIETLADYVDVICPMFYPSHFPREFIPELSYLDRARQIYREGTWRAASITGGRSLIRPYVQAFLIGGELRMEAPEYSRYLLQQIEGALEAPSSGFTLWNASNHYYMLTMDLRPLLQREAGLARGEAGDAPEAAGPAADAAGGADGASTQGTSAHGTGGKGGPAQGAAGGDGGDGSNPAPAGPAAGAPNLEFLD